MTDEQWRIRTKLLLDIIRASHTGNDYVYVQWHQGIAKLETDKAVQAIVYNGAESVGDLVREARV